MKRVFAEFVGLFEQGVEHHPFMVEVTLQEGLRKIILVFEVIEESRLGDVCFADDFFD